MSPMTRDLELLVMIPMIMIFWCKINKSLSSENNAGKHDTHIFNYFYTNVNYLIKVKQTYLSFNTNCT